MTYRRTQSSLKYINTIERPKYARPSPIDTSQLDGKDDEIPFIPVSPDSDDEEDEYPFTTSTVSSYAQPAQRLSAEMVPTMGPTASTNGDKHQYDDEPVVTEEQQPAKQRHSTLSVADVDYSMLSNLSDAFVRKIKALEHVRELFCSNEYPEAFTGQEAVVSEGEEKREKGRQLRETKNQLESNSRDICG